LSAFAVASPPPPSAVLDVTVVAVGVVTGVVEELCEVTQIMGSKRVELHTGTQELRRPIGLVPVPVCDDLRRRDVEASDPDRVSGDPLRCRHMVDLFGDVDDERRSFESSSSAVVDVIG
jgi:hypothetical protein